MYEHHIFYYFCLKYFALDLDLRQSFKKKNPTNIGELQHMQYICDKIILDTEYEKLHTYFKTKVVGEFFLWSLLLIYIKLNLRPFGYLRFLVENSLKICVFHFFQQ
jgi:hypothetical protein